MRTNQGYEIISACPISLHDEVVLACLHENNYVTWMCSNGDNYFWGHYFGNEKDALLDYAERIKNEVQFV